MVGLGCTSETRMHKYIVPHLQCLIHLVVFIHVMNALFVSILVEYVMILFLQVQPHNSSMSWMPISRSNRCFECCIPSYHMQKGCEESFEKHLDILKYFYYEVKLVKVRDGMKHFMPFLRSLVGQITTRYVQDGHEE